MQAFGISFDTFDESNGTFRDVRRYCSVANYDKHGCLNLFVVPIAFPPSPVMAFLGLELLVSLVIKEEGQADPSTLIAIRC